MIELYTTKDCPRCMKVRAFFESNNIQYTEHVIDEDPEAQADALMLDIVAAPAVKIGKWILKPKAIFKDGELTKDFKALVLDQLKGEAP
jgi:glutaredoxin